MDRSVLPVALMRRQFVGAVFGLVGLFVATKAEAARPDWCGSYKPDADDSNATWVEDHLRDKEWSDRARSAAAMGACDKPDDPARQKMVDGWRTRYLAYYGGTAKDFSAMLAVYVNDAGRKAQQEKVCKALKQDARDGATSQYERVLDQVLSCDEVGVSPKDIDESILAYWTDRPTSPEAARAYQVAKSYKDNDAFGWNFTSLSEVIPDAATAEALDRGRLDAQIAADARLNVPFARVRLQELHNRARSLAEAWRTVVYKNAVAKRILIDAPVAAIQGWQTAYASHKEALDYTYDLAAKIDVDPASAKGCSTKLRGYLSAYIAEKKPATAAAAHALFIDNVGYPLVYGLQLCEAIDGRPLVSQAHAHELVGDGLSPRRLHGPRAAAFYAAKDAFAKEEKTNNQMPFKGLDEVGSKVESDFEQKLPKDSTRYLTAEATIASVKKVKDGTVQVSFKNDQKTNFHESCAEDRWGEVKCRPNGKTSIDQIKKVPIVVTQEHAALFVPGRAVAYAFDADGQAGPTMPDTRPGYPLQVFTKKDKKSLVAYCGMSLASDAAKPTKAPATAQKGKKKKKK